MKNASKFSPKKNSRSLSNSSKPETTSARNPSTSTPKSNPDSTLNRNCKPLRSSTPSTTSLSPTSDSRSTTSARSYTSGISSSERKKKTALTSIGKFKAWNRTARTCSKSNSLFHLKFKISVKNDDRLKKSTKVWRTNSVRPIYKLGRSARSLIIRSESQWLWWRISRFSGGMRITWEMRMRSWRRLCRL